MRRRSESMKSDAALELETANSWAARAISCFARAADVARSAAKSQSVAMVEEAGEWRLRAENYRHEALEHAALVGDHGKTVGAIQRKIDGAFRTALTSKAEHAKRRRSVR